MSIVKEIDKLSGTNTRSRNITQAIDKLTGKGPSKNIGDAVRKMQEDAPTEKLLMTGGAVVDAGNNGQISNFTIITDQYYEGAVKIVFTGYRAKIGYDSEYVDYPDAYTNSNYSWSISPDTGYTDDSATYLPHAANSYFSANPDGSQTTSITNENADERPEYFTWDKLEVYAVEE